MEKSANHNHQHTGKRGEDYACQYLQQQGYSIIARNWRYKKTETDIIASCQQVLHFIEVKTLNTPFKALPELKVNQAKLRQMKLGAAGYLEQNPTWIFIQFDVLAIRFDGDNLADILLIEDVF